MGVRDCFSLLEPKVTIVRRDEMEIPPLNETQEVQRPWWRNVEEWNIPPLVEEWSDQPFVEEGSDSEEEALEVPQRWRFFTLPVRPHRRGDLNLLFFDFISLYPSIIREFRDNLRGVSTTGTLGFNSTPRATLYGLLVQREMDRIRGILEEWNQRRHQRIPEPAVHPPEEEERVDFGWMNTEVMFYAPWTPLLAPPVKHPSLSYLAHQVHLLFLMRGWF